MTDFKKGLRHERRGRVFMGLLAILLILIGTGTVLKGDLTYRNYWGGLVFAPIVIPVGLVLLYLVIFRWRKLSQRPERLKGRAARRAQRAAEYRSMIDDYDKPWK
jgi:hypothetical protein